MQRAILQLSSEDFDRVISVNLAYLSLLPGSCRLMAERGNGGVIINIASTRAFMSEPGTEAYTASKGGIVCLPMAWPSVSGPMVFG